MKKFTVTQSTQPAQIGVTAVLLTTVLLAIGITVTSRVVNQVNQDTQRTESGQAYNIAESTVDSKVESAPAPGADGVLTTSKFSTSRGKSVIYLEAGESVEVRFAGSAPGDTDRNSDVRDQVVYWEDAGSGNTNCITDGSGNYIRPALLLSWYPEGGGVQYMPVAARGCPVTGASKNLTGYVGADDDAPGGEFSSFLNSYKITDFSGKGTLRIKALYAGTYVSMDKLTRITRAAASNTGSNAVRVSEQNETDPTAPSVFDYGIFVANGSITQ